MKAVRSGRFAGEGRAMLTGLAIGSLMVAGLLAWFPLAPKPADNVLPLDATCNLSGHTCSRTLPDGTEVEMHLEPDHPMALKDFGVEVRVYGGVAKRVEFAVRDADGALDRARLERVGPGRWDGKGMLSWCGTAAMAATAVVESGGKEWRVPFAFNMEPSR
jgi:hypothetical protein